MYSDLLLTIVRRSANSHLCNDQDSLERRLFSHRSYSRNNCVLPDLGPRGICQHVCIRIDRLLLLRKQPSGVYGDPASIAGLASLVAESNILSKMQRLRSYETQAAIDNEVGAYRICLEHTQMSLIRSRCWIPPKPLRTRLCTIGNVTPTRHIHGGYVAGRISVLTSSLLFHFASYWASCSKSLTIPYSMAEISQSCKETLPSRYATQLCRFSVLHCIQIGISMSV